MRIEEAIKGLSFLGLAYGKEYSQLEVQQVYEFIKEYNYETFIKAVKELIRTSKFLPKIADLIETCEKQKEAIKIEVVEYMKNDGYFTQNGYLDDTQASKNYNKTISWLERGTTPEWLKNDINLYYQKMHNIQIETKQNKLLS